jgi:hypothetical protein
MSRSPHFNLRTHGKSIEPLEFRVAPASFLVTNPGDSGDGSPRDVIGATKVTLDAQQKPGVFLIRSPEGRNSEAVTNQS